MLRGVAQYADPFNITRFTVEELTQLANNLRILTYVVVTKKHISDHKMD